MLCFQLYPCRPSRTRDARCSVGEITCCTREPEISSELHLILRLFADELFSEVSAQVSQQPNTNLDRNINLKRKRSQSFRIFARSSHCRKLREALKQTTSSLDGTGRELSREPFTGISRKFVGKVHATIPKDILISFEFTFLQTPKKFERMAREAMDVCLRVLKESNKSRFDSYSVRNSVLIISHITFRDCRVHFFSDNVSRNSFIEAVRVLCKLWPA